MHWKCIVSFDKRGRAGEEVKPSHIGGGQGGEVDQAGEQDGSNSAILLTSPRTILMRTWWSRRRLLASSMNT